MRCERARLIRERVSDRCLSYRGFAIVSYDSGGETWSNLIIGCLRVSHVSFNRVSPGFSISIFRSPRRSKPPTKISKLLLLRLPEYQTIPLRSDTCAWKRIKSWWFPSRENEISTCCPDSFHPELLFPPLPPFYIYLIESGTCEPWFRHVASRVVFSHSHDKVIRTGNYICEFGVESAFNFIRI